MIDLLMPTIAQGLLWAIMALGVYITYRVLDIADLTVEGSFPLGAAVAASLLAGGYSPWCGDAGWYAGWRCDRTFTY
jgi:putative ABC transport system permease protein